MDEDYKGESPIPKTQLETDRSSGDGRPPSNTAVGLNDGAPEPGSYKVGQRLKCLIIAARKGGYDVLIMKDDVRAFLRTDKKYEQGAVLVGEFRHWQNIN